MISFESAMGLIRSTLNLGVSLAEVFVDTVGDPAKYEASLTERFPGIKFTVSKKADSLFPIVSAASIIAKVCEVYGDTLCCFHC
jgi:ribonuclease H2 subunit A